MFYKTVVSLLFLTCSLKAMQSDNGSLPSSNDETEKCLNKASHDIWDILERFTQGKKVSNQEVMQSNKEYEQAYQEFLARHKQDVSN